MTAIMAAALAFALAAEVEVPAGAPLADALARARPGDLLRLGPGIHRGSLGRAPTGIHVAGAGAGVTVIAAQEGDDGVVVSGALELKGLTLRAGPERCALKVVGGTVSLRDVALVGGACGALVDAGRLSAREVVLSGRQGLLVRDGEVSLEEGSARGQDAGVALTGGTVALRRFQVTGPSREAGISVAGGALDLQAVVIRSPGPAGIAVSGGARVQGVELVVAGAAETARILGDCIQVIHGTVRLEAATLVRCAGAAVEASGADIRLAGVDAAGGAAGCVILVNGANADLTGNLCAGRGPGLVVASRSRARLVANRWWTDPVLWADCGTGARVEVGRGEKLKAPCGASP